ncbi:hypothetical protein KUTeg_013976 [Tegillarca granosa]|uniref:Uncharacterized protein n=1 Tax=Tegillarca granosa TaxID=220873 RepID=A0ABQ9EZQ1_TEGGR|nr:hypothetical protein KUTeg_013976 [Tegillarca granosa]
MRDSMVFETYATEIFYFFDEIIVNLENVDAALTEIRRVSQLGIMRSEMFKDMRATFMETLSLTLEDRFTETAEENYKLLNSFVIFNARRYTLV